MKLAIASNNEHKLQEIKSILGGCFDELLGIKELGIDIDIASQDACKIEHNISDETFEAIKKHFNNQK